MRGGSSGQEEFGWFCHAPMAWCLFGVTGAEARFRVLDMEDLSSLDAIVRLEAAVCARGEVDRCREGIWDGSGRHLLKLYIYLTIVSGAEALKGNVGENKGSEPCFGRFVTARQAWLYCSCEKATRSRVAG